MSFISVDGSISYTLRTCQQTLVKLYDHLKHLPQDAEDIAEAQRCGDAIDQLFMWDSETGAGQGQLDHGLQKASMLRDGMNELLQELTTISDEGGYCEKILISLLISSQHFR